MGANLSFSADPESCSHPEHALREDTFFDEREEDFVDFTYCDQCGSTLGGSIPRSIQPLVAE